MVGAGGVFGASCAWHLARAGAEVVMVDPLREGRATAAGAGIICPWSSAVTDPAHVLLSTEGARAYPGIIAALAEDGEHDTGYKRVGALCAPAEPAELDRVEARVRTRAAQAPGAGTLTRLSPREARTLFPPLAEKRAALHVEGAARVDGRRLAAALGRAAARHGAEAVEGEAEPVLEGRRIRGVRVRGRLVEADTVVVTAGAWAPALLAPLGVPLPVQPQRGQIVHLRLPGTDTSAWPVLLPMTPQYLLAFDDSRVVVGATREAGSGFDHRVTAGGLHEVLSAGLAAAPGLARFGLHEVRIGFRPMGPTIRPMLARVPELEGLVVGNGLGAGGLTIGPNAGRLLAQLTLGMDPGIDLAPFAIGQHGML